MADSIFAAVADAIVTELTGNDFGIQFECQRSYLQWIEKLTDLEVGPLYVDVVPVTVPPHPDLDQASQNDVNFEYAYDICVRKRFITEERNNRGRIPNEQIDPLVKLAEDIVLLLPKRPLTDYSEASWVSTNWRALAYKDHLTKGQFTAAIRVIYSIVVDLT